MRNKTFIPAIASWRGQSPGGGGQRRALAVKMNNFFEEVGSQVPTEVPVGTWPLKNEKRRRPRRPRPLTATLERPRLLDIALQGKIDMSLMRKELLSIYTLMRVPLAVKQPTRQIKRPKGAEISDESLDDENTVPLKVKAKTKKCPKNNEGIPSIVIDVPQPQKGSARIPVLRRDTSPLKLVTAMGRNVKMRARRKIDEAFCGPISRPLTQPCDSCGRASRPERLHTHPPPPSPASPAATKVIKPSSSARTISQDVSNPGFRDGKLLGTAASVVDRRRRSPVRRVPPEGPRPSRAEPEPEPHVAGVPLLCSYCGRRFGSASIAIHEAKCRERRDTSPVKVARPGEPHQPHQPPHPLPNTRHFTSPQRRLPSPVKKVDDQRGLADAQDKANSHNRPAQINLTVPVMHTPRTRSPQESPRKLSLSPRRVTHSPAIISSSPVRVPHSPGRILGSPRAVPNFGSPRASSTSKIPNCSRILHSPAATGATRIPLQQSPEADDYVFREDGNLDCEATFHRIWDNHLKSLVQCSCCGRNFAPERIERHQAGCTGVSKRIASRPAHHRS